MPDVPSVSGKDAVRAFKRLGFFEVRTNASHVILKKEGHRFLLSVPVHANKDVKVGTLRGLIKASGHTLAEFVESL